MNTIEITTDNYDEIVKSNEIVLIDFNAKWCGPCKTLTPIIEELATDNLTKENIVISKVDVDSNKDLAAKFGIRSIPTIIYLKNGEMIDKSVGLSSKIDLQNKINSL
jgi:thioredoxin 1